MTCNSFHTIAQGSTVSCFSAILKTQRRQWKKTNITPPASSSLHAAVFFFIGCWLPAEYWICFWLLCIEELFFFLFYFHFGIQFLSFWNSTLETFVLYSRCNLCLPQQCQNWNNTFLAQLFATQKNIVFWSLLHCVCGKLSSYQKLTQHPSVLLSFSFSSLLFAQKAVRHSKEHVAVFVAHPFDKIKQQHSERLRFSVCLFHWIFSEKQVHFSPKTFFCFQIWVPWIYIQWMITGFVEVPELTVMPVSAG